MKLLLGKKIKTAGAEKKKKTTITKQHVLRGEVLKNPKVTAHRGSNNILHCMHLQSLSFRLQ